MLPYLLLNDGPYLSMLNMNDVDAKENGYIKASLINQQAV
jgi:hypothetical protein